MDTGLFLWDFWQIRSADGFRVLSLSADRGLVAKEQHHFSARLAIYYTRDFQTFTNLKPDNFCADPVGWDNTAIWSGDVIRWQGRYVLFYTSRNLQAGEMDQHIGMAEADDLAGPWARLPVILSADSRYYQTATDPAESSIHAWRDPFFFQEDGKSYLLVAAKARGLPKNQRGCIAVLRAEDDSLLRWRVLPPIYAPGTIGEIELPQLYRKSNGALVLCFNSHEKHDAGIRERKGGFYAMDFMDAIMSKDSAQVELLATTEDTGLYGFRVIPELDGRIVGFHLQDGGPASTSIKTGWSSANQELRSEGE